MEEPTLAETFNLGIRFRLALNLVLPPRHTMAQQGHSQ